jgi:hypothetical protein
MKLIHWRVITFVLFFCAFIFWQSGREFVVLYATAPFMVQVAISFIVAIAVMELGRWTNILVAFVLYEISEHTAKVFEAMTGKKTKVRGDGFDIFENVPTVHDYSPMNENMKGSIEHEQ